MNWELFRQILEQDSTSGKERKLAEWLLEHLQAPSKQAFEVGDGTLNLLLSWGTPKVVFCTHMDTVPPYIPPQAAWDTLASLGMTEGSLLSFRGPEGRENLITGRGSCDAKGQLFAMYTACKELEEEGCSGFGLLLLAGEETGSWGAKAFAKTAFRAPYLIVGEPTENKMVSASKGTQSYDLCFTGEAFHSGYPQFGVSAIDLFNDFYNKLKATDFGMDPILGETTWNVGLLQSDNPQNILSPRVCCRLYFRTTFVSHEAVRQWMEAAASETLSVTPRGGDTPARYLTLEGFDSAPVAFGSDAPHLSNFTHKAICGPGSIRVAHRSDERILVQDLETAVQQYKNMFLLISRL